MARNVSQKCVVNIFIKYVYIFYYVLQYIAYVEYFLLFCDFCRSICVKFVDIAYTHS